MQYLIGLLLLLLLQTSIAAECRVDGGPWTNMRTSPLYAYVDLQLDPAARRVTMSGYSIECRHNFPGFFPEHLAQKFSTLANGYIRGPSVQQYVSGMELFGQYLDWPVSAGRILAVQDGREPVSQVPLKVYFNYPFEANQYIRINAGTLLAAFQLLVSYNFDSPSYPAYSTNSIHLIARNGVDASPSTCAINNNAPMTVDFGPVDPAAIGGNIFNTPFRQAKTLTFSCEGPGVNSPVFVRWEAIPSDFERYGIATNNADLSVILFRTESSGVVGAGREFRTTITNSTGTTGITFALVRRPGSYPAEGPFTASGTLVLSMP